MMPISSPATPIGRRELPLRLVLAACGRRRELTALMDSAAPALAAALELPLRPLDNPDAPIQCLEGLLTPPEAADAGWLAPLGLDPGLPLPSAGCWAEALGAWRQPCLLLLRGEELDTGRPAAATALLRQWGVPLLGLVQWGRPWCPSERRGDGLPWLGWLPRPDDSEDASRERDQEEGPGQLDARLGPLLRRRLARLDLG